MTVFDHTSTQAEHLHKVCVYKQDQQMADLQTGGPGDTSLALEAEQQSLVTGLIWVLFKEGSRTVFRALTYLE